MDGRALLAEGRDAEVLDWGGGRVAKVLRDPTSAPRVAREVAALGALQEGRIAAPAPLGTVTVEGRPALVMERVDGGDLLDSLVRAPWRLRRAGRVLGAVHAGIHEMPAPSGLPDIREEVERVVTPPGALPEELREACALLLSGLPDGDRLGHGDLHLGNLVGTWANPSVIDWSDAVRCDPAADVARTIIEHRVVTGHAPPGRPALLSRSTAIGARALVTSYLRSYRRVRPLEDPDVRRWEVLRAAALAAEESRERRGPLLAFARERLRTLDP